MVDFGKHVGKQKNKRPLDPVEIYDGLDRASDTGPLRPIQQAVLTTWHTARRDERDLIIKLHTGQGKTLIGFLVLQSKLNEGTGPALYVCPNNFLVAQTAAEAEKFGIPVVVATGGEDLPNEFFNSQAILITSVQMLINGLTKFKLGAKSVKVGALVMDDAHACIDAIQSQTSISISHGTQPYADLLHLFGDELQRQGGGTFADLRRNVYSALLPVPYWAWIDKTNEVAEILSRNTDRNEIKFPWPLLRDVLPECQCIFSGTSVEIHPYVAPLDAIGSYTKANHRYFMSATVTEDSFLVRGLGIAPEVIRRPLVFEKEKWSGEKMILIPSLIDSSLSREVLVEMFGKPSDARTYGIVALTPSREGSKDWEKYGATVANKDPKKPDIDQCVAALRDGAFEKTLVMHSRYDGIDLPDAACRVLVFDSKPFSESLLDRY
ncbi:MAG: DEAD/DEAH box helicase family protein, partial [Myxococcales bacterium]